MSSTSTGMSRTAYNTAIEKANNAAALAALETSLSGYKNDLAASVALVRALREVHLTHLNATGSTYVSGAINEVEYHIRNLKSSVKDAENRIARLQGEVPAEDD